MCKKNANINLIYGTNGSGKSRLIRDLMKKDGSYLFTFYAPFAMETCNKESVEEMYKFLKGEEIGKLDILSFSEKVLLQFCYEIISILEMDEPFNKLFIDGFPCIFDKNIFVNILSLFRNLSDQGFKIYFSTNKITEAIIFKNFFSNEPEQNFKVINLSETISA